MKAQVVCTDAQYKTMMTGWQAPSFQPCRRSPEHTTGGGSARALRRAPATNWASIRNHALAVLWTCLICLRGGETWNLGAADR